MEYLGHLVTPRGLEPQAAKVAAMAALPEPANLAELCSVLGLLNYYRCYIPRFSEMAAPLNQLTQQGVAYVWTAAHSEAFAALKRELCRDGAVLRRPDPGKPYVVHTDWCTYGISAILGQRDEQDREYLVACASRSLNKHERNYEPWKGELLGAIWGMKTFRWYLLGTQFELVTDHSPLLWMLYQKEPTAQLHRWIVSVSEFDFIVRYRQGVKHTNADVVSRNPLPTTVDSTGARMHHDSDPVRPSLPLVVTHEGAEPRQAVEADIIADLETLRSVCSVSCAALTHTADQCHALCAVFRHVTAGDGASHQAGGALAALLDPCPFGMGSAGDEPDLLCDQQAVLTAQATNWVATAHQRGLLPSAPAQQQLSPASGVLNLASVAATFFTAAPAGVVVCELFGGLCAGVEMLLRNRVPVRAVVYADISPAAQAIAQHRLRTLAARYPALLAPTALDRAFSLLPQDVYSIQQQHVQAAVQQLGGQWLLVGGWECKNLSPAGNNTGLFGARSKTYFELLRIASLLQQCCTLPPAYLFENTAFQYNWNSELISKQQFQQVCSDLGYPVCVDAAQFGSRAHRLRNFWSNLFDSADMQAALSLVTRPAGLLVQDVLPPHRQPAPVTKPDLPPMYPCNQLGAPRAALPTLMAAAESWAFHPKGAGAIWDMHAQQYDQPTAQERELCLGYTLAAGDTAAAGVTEQQRRTALGNCMDANTLQTLFAVAAALQRYHAQSTTAALVQVVVTTPSPAASPGDPSWCHALSAADIDNQPARYMQGLLAAVAAAEASEERAGSKPGSADIWRDAPTMTFVQVRQLPEGMPATERRRVTKRAAAYVWSEGRLLRSLSNGDEKEVPEPEQRQELIKQHHERCGHFGHRRTYALLLHCYWWHGMWVDVQQYVKCCALCDRAQASFNKQQPVLQPLPIGGMFYRWGIDLAGPFAATSFGNEYVLVAVEHFTKWVELVPIPNKSAATTAFVTAHHVLGRFGGCAELVTDQGTEWGGEFHELLQLSFIDHRRTSAYRPQADGLAERVVQTMKRCLDKVCDSPEKKTTWDLELPWVALGYRCSPQKSTGLSPFQMLYATTPHIPVAVRPRLEQPVDPTAAEAAADYEQRAKLLRQYGIIAWDNQRIAQHRDTLHYARRRDGTYLPKVQRYLPGEFVWVARHDAANLDLPTRPHILRVVESRPSGVLLLQGRDGDTVTVHAAHCAPCHLPNIDTAMDLSLLKVGEDHACQVCQRTDGESVMLLCHHCASGYHTYCLQPPLEQVPLGIWLCPVCTDSGVTEADVVKAIDQQNQRVLEQQHPERLTPAIRRAQELHGRYLTGRFLLKGQRGAPGGGRAKVQTMWAKLKYAGVAANGKPVLLAVWEDGEVLELTARQCSTGGRVLQPAGCTFPQYETIMSAVAQVVPVAAAAISKTPALLELLQPSGAAVQATLQFEAQLQPWPFAPEESMSRAVTKQLWSEVAACLDLTAMATLTLLNQDLLCADAGDAFPWLRVTASCVIATSLQLVQPSSGMQTLFAALTDAAAAQLVARCSELQPAATLLVLSAAQAPLLVEALAGANHTACTQLCLPGGRSFTLGVVCPTPHVLATVMRQVLTCSE